MKSTPGTIGEKGIGLGLKLTKELIEINGGSLQLKSELNKGTSMSFTIPKQILDERNF
jgi:signal transduction histidine kinase